MTPRSSKTFARLLERGIRPTRTTRTRLARLVGSGLFREVGASPQDPKRRYFATR